MVEMCGTVILLINFLETKRQANEPITFHLVTLDAYWILIGGCFSASSSSTSLLSLLFLLVRFPCKIGVQLFTDAFCHEIHRPYFLVDSVNRIIFMLC